jgi:hypothetical protein
MFELDDIPETDETAKKEPQIEIKHIDCQSEKTASEFYPIMRYDENTLLCCGIEGLETWDISDPLNVKPIGRYFWKQQMGVSPVINKKIYLGYHTIALDASDPANIKDEAENPFDTPIGIITAAKDGSIFALSKEGYIGSIDANGHFTKSAAQNKTLKYKEYYTDDRSADMKVVGDLLIVAGVTEKKKNLQFYRIQQDGTLEFIKSFGKYGHFIPIHPVLNDGFLFFMRAGTMYMVDIRDAANIRQSKFIELKPKSYLREDCCFYYSENEILLISHRDIDAGNRSRVMHELFLVELTQTGPVIKERIEMPDMDIFMPKIFMQDKYLMVYNDAFKIFEVKRK